MTFVPRSWLPCAGPGEAEASIASAVEDWIGHWLADPPVLVCVPLDETSRNQDIALSVRNKAALGLAACGNRADAANPRDLEVLEAVGTALLEDLQAWLAGLESAEIGPAGKSAFVLRSAGKPWSIRIALSDGQINCLRKRAAGALRKIEPAPLMQALQTETGVLGCHLGRARLTAADISALSPGDLIVLDRGLNDIVPVTVQGNVCAAGSARVARDGGAIGIRMAEAIGLHTRIEEIDG